MGENADERPRGVRGVAAPEETGDEPERPQGRADYAGDGCGLNHEAGGRFGKRLQIARVRCDGRAVEQCREQPDDDGTTADERGAFASEPDERCGEAKGCGPAKDERGLVKQPAGRPLSRKDPHVEADECGSGSTCGPSQQAHASRVYLKTAGQPIRRDCRLTSLGRQVLLGDQTRLGSLVAHMKRLKLGVKYSAAADLAMAPSTPTASRAAFFLVTKSGRRDMANGAYASGDIFSVLGVNVVDIRTFVLAAVVLTMTGLVAGWLPAPRRATGSDSRAARVAEAYCAFAISRTHETRRASGASAEVDIS